MGVSSAGLLVVVSLFLGGASATIAVSAYSLLLPLLLVWYGLRPLDGLLVCFGADAVNGVLLFVHHRRKLQPRQLQMVLGGAFMAALVAPVAALWFGIGFLKRHGHGMKSTTCLISVLMGLGFLVKWHRLRQRYLEGLGPSGIEDEPDLLQTTSLDAPMLPGNQAQEQQDVEGGQQLEPNASALESDSCPELVDGKMYEVETPKLVLSAAFIFTLSVLAGVIGFTGGNAFAILFIAVFRWSHLASTGSGGFMSASLALGLFFAYLADRDASLKTAAPYMAVVLPCCAVGVLISSWFVKKVSEHNLNLIVAAVLILVGFATLIISLTVVD